MCFSGTIPAHVESLEDAVNAAITPHRSEASQQLEECPGNWKIESIPDPLQCCDGAPSQRFWGAGANKAAVHLRPPSR